MVHVDVDRIADEGRCVAQVVFELDLGFAVRRHVRPPVHFDVRGLGVADVEMPIRGRQAERGTLVGQGEAPQRFE